MPRTTPSRRYGGNGWATLAALLFAAAAAAGQETAPVPAFPTQAEAITVDVLVLDKDGRPVRGLGRDEFALLEDGRVQPIVGFEPRAMDALADRSGPGDEGTVAATNEHGKTQRGRTLAFLVDDLGIEPLHLTNTTKAISRWLGASADPRDEVTLLTSSGDAWWSDTVGEGRADLEAVLGRMKGKRRLGSTSDAMSDWEAYNIDSFGSPLGGPEAAATGPPTGLASCSTNAPSSNILDRVVDRWFDTGACLCQPMDIGSSIRACRSLVMGRGRQNYSDATRRAQVLLEGVERLSRGLSGARGRKSIFILSEGLLRDTEQRAFDRAVDASRRGNTSVSFVDVRGLIGMPSYGADQTAAPKPGDLGVLSTEITLLETAGGDHLAETTGGSMVRNTNDLAGAVTRLADETSAYYLLGYQTDRPSDGKWHKLEVKVSRPGVKVRARRGYFATAAAAIEPRPVKKRKADKKDVKEELPVRALDPALAVGGEQSEIPLRIAPYVFETTAEGTVRVLVAIEVGTEPLAFKGTGGQRTAQIDVSVLGVSRDLPKMAPLDSHVDLSLDAKVVGGWWTFTREFHLPPGPAQIRALVRDTVSGRSGLVARRVEIPRPEAPYLSTLLLGNRLQVSAPGSRPKIVPVAHRRFPPRGSLYCAYEVYVAPGKDPKAMPKVVGSYTLVDDAGRVVWSQAPTLIAIALGAQIVRMHVFPLDRLAPGSYRLNVAAVDPNSGVNLTASDGFVVEDSTEGAPKGK